MPSIVSRRPVAVWVSVFVAVCGLMLLAGCNLFSPLASDDADNLTYRGLILKGSQAINDKDYTSAQGYFVAAMALNPKGAEAFLFSSKALMNKYRIDYNSLNKEFDIRRNKDGLGKPGIPFIDSTTTIEGIDSIYYPVAQSVENLEHIIRKKTLPIVLSGGYFLPPDGDRKSTRLNSSH